MKRGSSSTKENGNRHTLGKYSASKRPLGHHPSLLSSTQTAFLSQSSTIQQQFFSQTLGPHNFQAWVRPESKQAYRKVASRPETSKGTRPVERLPRQWTNDACHSQYQPERAEQKVDIEIVVTKNRRRESRKCQRSKFETDLDDEFLQLFAN